jgi:tRNA dimethylallyltransferase
MKPPIVIVCGPTATGKTACAIKIAKQENGEVVNADSMQVYRHLDIGTAKPTQAEQAAVPFHLVDVADPEETFSTGRFKELADKAIADITARRKLPVVAGGTGLYLKALTQGIFEGPEADQKLRARLMAEEEQTPGSLRKKLKEIDPEKAKKLPPNDLGRIVRALEVFELTGKAMSVHQKEHAFAESPYQALWIGLSLNRELLYQRINDRVVRMMNEGWLDEVRALRDRDFDRKSAAANALGYRTLLAHLDGDCTLEQAIETIQQETRKFAKRQITWYKPNKEIHWFAYPDQLTDILSLTRETIRSWQRTT